MKNMKMILISLLIGIVVGLFEVFYRWCITQVTFVREIYAPWLIFLLPLCGLGIVYLFNQSKRDIKGGLSLVYDVLEEKRDTLPYQLGLCMFVACLMSHLFGASTGRTAVSIQVGVVIAYWISSRFSKDSIYIYAGVAAAFSGLFQTPIAAIFFSMELFKVHSFNKKAFIPCTISSITSCLIAYMFGYEKTLFYEYPLYTFRLPLVLELVVLGLVFGLSGFVYAYCSNWLKSFVKLHISNAYIRIFGGSILLVILLFILGYGRYSGSGAILIDMAMNGSSIYSYDFLCKFLLTILTMAIGFQGGELLPLLTIGTCLGYVLSPFISLPVFIVCALGYIGLFSSGTNMIFAPIFFGAEIFGFQYIPLFVVVCVVAYICNGNQTVFNRQKRENKYIVKSLK